MERPGRVDAVRDFTRWVSDTWQREAVFVKLADIPLERENVHPERSRETRDLSADAAIADDSDSCATQFGRHVSGPTIFCPVFDSLVLKHGGQPVSEGENLGQRILGHWNRVNTTGGCESHLLIQEERMIKNVIHACRVKLNPFELGRFARLWQRIEGVDHVYVGQNGSQVCGVPRRDLR